MKEKEVVYIDISQEKIDKYYDLIEKWGDHSFKSKTEEHEFIQVLKDLLDEDQTQIEFEAIIHTLNILAASVYLKKFNSHTFSASK